MTKLAHCIAQMEGFYQEGSVPQTHCNPGDLRHSPHSEHDPAHPNAIGLIDTEEHGWEDLERQLTIYASRGMNLRDTIDVYAPPTENNTGHYLDFMCKSLECGPDALVSDLLRIAV